MSRNAQADGANRQAVASGTGSTVARRFRRGWGRRGLRDAAPIDLTGRQDGGSIPGWTADARRWIQCVVGDRVASDQRDARGGGIIGPRADGDRPPAPPLDPAVPVAARLGTPVMLPGWILDIPPSRHKERRGDGGAARRPAGEAATPGEGIVRT